MVPPPLTTTKFSDNPQMVALAASWPSSRLQLGTDTHANHSRGLHLWKGSHAAVGERHVAGKGRKGGVNSRVLKSTSDEAPSPT